jgi:hypothetical protein
VTRQSRQEPGVRRAGHPALDAQASVTGTRSGRYPAQMRSTRHRSGAAGIAMLVALAVAVAACAGSAGPTSPASDTPGGASAPPSVGPSSAPVETAPPATPPQSEPPPSPSDSEAPPESAAPSDSPETNGAAAACTGTDNNRDFYADAATALDFAVYCPVLPRGWFVDQGEYTLRNGGMLHITYKGPNGAALELVERGPCGSGDDCIPSGTEEGQASFGDLPAEVVALDDGRLAIVAEEVGVGQWWIIGRGVDEPALTEIASDLARVGG